MDASEYLRVREQACNAWEVYLDAKQALEDEYIKLTHEMEYE